MDSILKILLSPLDLTIIVALNSLGIAIMLWSGDQISKLSVQIRTWPNGDDNKIQNPWDEILQGMVEMLFATGMLHAASLFFISIHRPEISCNLGCSRGSDSIILLLSSSATILAMLITVFALTRFSLLTYRQKNKSLKADGDILAFKHDASV